MRNVLLILLLFLPAGMSGQGQPVITALDFEKARSQSIADTTDYGVPLWRGLTDQARFDSIQKMTLMRLGVRIPNNQFFAALAYKQRLGLKPLQEDQLVEQGLLISKLWTAARINKDSTFNPRFYEFAQLEKILSKKQYEDFLGLKNTQLALRDVFLDWNGLKEYNLLTKKMAADSVQICKKIFEYRLALRVVTDLCYDNDVRKREGYNNVNIYQRPSYITDLLIAKGSIRASSPTGLTRPPTIGPTLRAGVTSR